MEYSLLKETQKQAYNTPKLERYGNLREITLTVGGGGKKDGHGNLRTHAA